MAMLKDILAKKDVEIAEYKRALHDAEGKNGVLLADLRGAHGMADDVRNLKELLSKRDADLDGMKAENARMKMDMTRDIERLEAETARVTGRLRAEADALRGDMEVLNRDNQQLTGTIEAMRSEKATIVEQSMQDKDSLMAAMHDFEAQVTELRRLKANAEQQVVHLTSRCAELESENVKVLQARDNAEALARGEIKLLHEQLERSERERQSSL